MNKQKYIELYFYKSHTFHDQCSLFLQSLYNISFLSLISLIKNSDKPFQSSQVLNEKNYKSPMFMSKEFYVHDPPLHTRKSHG